MPTISSLRVVFTKFTEKIYYKLFHSTVEASLQVLLNGNESLSLDVNITIFVAVHKYNQLSRQF